MLLKMSYKYNGNAESVEASCSNYTFGLPKVFYLFHERHPEGLKELQKNSIVTDVEIRSFSNGEWRILKTARISLK